MKSIIILAIVSLSLLVIDAAEIKKRVHACYFSNWSQNRPGIGQYVPEKYESGLCSHILFGFVGINEEFKLEPTEKNDLDDLTGDKPVPGLYTRINDLKNNQPDLKTVLAFGDYLISQTKGELFRKMMASGENRKIFIDDVIKVLRKHKFDGFSVEWVPADDHRKEDFVLLIKEMREAFDKEKDISNLPRLLLTVALPPSIQLIKDGYDGKALSSSVDYFNLVSVDIYGMRDNETRLNVPIESMNGPSINETIRYLIEEQQVPKEQLVLELPTYGRGWRIATTENPEVVPSPALGLSPPGEFTNQSGWFGFFEICQMLEKNFVNGWNELGQVPFAYNNAMAETIWISYDDVQSIHAKLDYVEKMDLAGAFVYALEYDDFEGRCMSSNGKYPLIKIIGDRLGKRLDSQKEMTTIKFDGQRETTIKFDGEKETTTRSDIPKETTIKFDGQRETTIKSDVEKEMTTTLGVQTETTTRSDIPKETTTRLGVEKETTTTELP